MGATTLEATVRFEQSLGRPERRPQLSELELWLRRDAHAASVCTGNRPAIRGCPQRPRGKLLSLSRPEKARQALLYGSRQEMRAAAYPNAAIRRIQKTMTAVIQAQSGSVIHAGTVASFVPPSAWGQRRPEASELRLISTKGKY
jgi:hypothetical protein